MTVNDILNCITEVAPLQWQESYDNAGLQVGDLNAEAHKALIALDVTEELVDEAIAKNSDLIISHHPLIFKGLRHLTPQTYIERAVAKAIKHDIAIISMHTNLDNSYLGVSRVLAERLGLKNLYILQPATDDPCLYGAGMVGEFDQPMEEADFLNLVAERIASPCLRHSALRGRKIQKVALCGGSGSPFMDDAIRQKADAYLTADIKYHDFFIPEGRFLLVDGGHFETEQFTKELICELVRKKFPTFAAEIAETETNSVHYFVRKK
ncbi:MAG: Nif3-like dinuclear metal center hexameric protein [Bacteroidales bacterium]|nr:Nif3-like dinuclear metal center hexameric protein [Bacteroidales bacterium]